MMQKILKWVLIAFIACIVIGIIAVVTESDEAKEKREAKQEERKEKREEEKEEKQDNGNEKNESIEIESNESNDDEVTWDDVKDMDKIVGRSDKDFSDISKSKPTDVRNDKTGNWRKSTLAEDIDIEQYALSYQELHMKENEVHHVINFTRNTTTWLNEMNGLLYVDIKERVDKEEHDASTLGSGMLLKSYVIYPDGDIQELEE